MPDILSIAIPTFGREGVLLDTLDQVLAAKPADAEVLVVDQTADHEVATRQRLHAWADAGDIRWIQQQQQQQPPSLTNARNRALRNGPLRREVAANPIKWPGAWCGFLRGVAYGWRHRRFQHGIESGAAHG